MKVEGRQETGNQIFMAVHIVEYAHNDMLLNEKIYKHMTYLFAVVSEPWLAASCPPNCSITPPHKKGGENIMEKFLHQDNDEEITHHHMQNRLDLGQLI